MSKKPARLPSQSADFSKWYTSVTLLAGMADYGKVRGTMVFKPYGFALWKNIQKALGQKIEDMGVEDVYFPMFIPYSLLAKEKKHVKGFSPEVAVVTHAGGEELAEPVVVRPTSETIMYAHFKDWIKSYRDLPLKINQWCNVVRWEKRTVLFLRTTEFLWQEGHTAHSSKLEAEEMTKNALEMYYDFATNMAAVYGIKGYKTTGEKFAGAEYTVTIETMLKNRKILQSCTSHMLGQHFSKAFGIQYLDENNKLQYVWQSSWGLSTRFIGAIIGAHGDDFGLVMPPRLAPIQVVIVPIIKDEASKVQILKQADILKKMLEGAGIRVKIDDSDKSPGYKFNEWDIKGVPIRLELGVKELTEERLTVYKRATREKHSLVFNNRLAEAILELLDETHALMLKRSREFVEENTTFIKNQQELEDLLKAKETPGFIKMFFKDNTKVAQMLQDRYKITPRVIPFETYDEVGNDAITNEPGARITLFGKAY